MLNLITWQDLFLTMNNNIENNLSSIEEIIEDARNGNVYSVDDPDREGDLPRSIQSRSNKHYMVED